MRKLHLHVASEINDGIEELWVTSESMVIRLSISVETGRIRTFSCKLDSDVVAEAGESRNRKNNTVYPMLHIFTTKDEHLVGSRYYIEKGNDGWLIDCTDEAIG